MTTTQRSQRFLRCSPRARPLRFAGSNYRRWIGPAWSAQQLRGEIDDPLEAMLARFSAPVAAQRKLKFNLPATPAERKWTVAQVEVVVRE